MERRLRPKAKATGIDAFQPPRSHFPETQFSFSPFLTQERWGQNLMTQTWHMRGLIPHLKV